MRTALLLLWCVAVAAAQAQSPPDLAPVRCAWAALSPERQTELRNSFTIDNRASDFIYYRHDKPRSAETLAAAQACNLSYTPTQLEALAGALGFKAREEVARLGIAARGAVKANIVDRAMASMHDWRRVEIGDRLACPSPMKERSWDRSLIIAMRRTGTKTVDGPSVHLVGLAMYAIMAQEGFMRRIAGANPSCPAPQ
jgi:hypothetical protein